MKRETVAERKALPIASGVLDYFPDALLAVAEVSRVGNEQHHPGEPLHWDKSKSTDEADALMRHLIDRGTTDIDGLRHTAKVAWRALALLQRELDAEGTHTHNWMSGEHAYQCACGEWEPIEPRGYVERGDTCPYCGTSYPDHNLACYMYAKNDATLG